MTRQIAIVEYRILNEEGQLVTRKAADDVTECLAEGADPESLIDNVYFKQVHGTPGFFDILGGCIEEEA